jgi:hypothetical protein
MEPVPPGKYGAEVRVVLPLDLRVVDAVHARSDEHLIEQAFGAERKPNVAVVKKHLNLKNELIDGECPRRRADETHLEKTENDRERDLTEVEAEGGGNVQVRVDMMDIVKTPEKWHTVVSQMPVVERQAISRRLSTKSRGDGSATR